MEKKFKLWILVLITLSLIYLAFSNRYQTQQPYTHFDESGMGTILFKYDRWTGKWIGEMRGLSQSTKGVKVFKY